jgi:hypothetical protein
MRKPLDIPAWATALLIAASSVFGAGVAWGAVQSRASAWDKAIEKIDRVDLNVRLLKCQLLKQCEEK